MLEETKKRKGHTMRQRKNQRHKSMAVTYRGFLELAGFEDESSSLEAILVTDTDEEFYVEVPNNRIDLSDYIDLYVKVSGTVTARDGCMVIVAKHVSSVDPLDEFETGDVDEYGEEYDDVYDDRNEIRDVMRFSGRSNKY